MCVCVCVYICIYTYIYIYIYGYIYTHTYPGHAGGYDAASNALPSHEPSLPSLCLARCGGGELHGGDVALRKSFYAGNAGYGGHVTAQLARFTRGASPTTLGRAASADARPGVRGGGGWRSRGRRGLGRWGWVGGGSEDGGVRAAAATCAVKPETEFRGLPSGRQWREYGERQSVCIASAFRRGRRRKCGLFDPVFDPWRCGRRP